MARSHGCIKVEIWDDPEFTKLSRTAQWTYFMLISQPEINNLGILPYLPNRWLGFCGGGITLKALEADVAELEEAAFVLLDREKCEVYVRSFIKHDKVWAQPYLIKNARMIFQYVKSERISMALRSRHPWLDDSTTPTEIREYEASFSSQKKTPFAFRPKPLPEPLTDSDGVGEGVGSSSVTSLSPLPTSPRDEAVREIYGHWRTTFGKTHCSYNKISEARKKKILARLEEFSKEDLIQVIDAAANDDWDGRAKNSDIELFFRNTGKVQYWLGRSGSETPTGIRYWQPGDLPL